MKISACHSSEGNRFAAVTFKSTVCEMKEGENVHQASNSVPNCELK